MHFNLSLKNNLKHIQLLTVIVTCKQQVLRIMSFASWMIYKLLRSFPNTYLPNYRIPLNSRTTKKTQALHVIEFSNNLSDSKSFTMTIEMSHIKRRIFHEICIRCMKWADWENMGFQVQPSFFFASFIPKLSIEIFSFIFYLIMFCSTCFNFVFLECDIPTKRVYFANQEYRNHFILSYCTEHSGTEEKIIGILFFSHWQHFYEFGGSLFIDITFT